MRSVFLYFDRATHDELREALTEWYPTQPGPPWIARARVRRPDPQRYLDLARHRRADIAPADLRTAGADDPDPALFIHLDRDVLSDLERDALDALHAALGGAPTAMLAVDVSGRHPGHVEVREFVERVLHRFTGLASDDYSDDLWTRDEVLHASKGARAFFQPPEHAP